MQHHPLAPCFGRVEAELDLNATVSPVIAFEVFVTWRPIQNKQACDLDDNLEAFET